MGELIKIIFQIITLNKKLRNKSLNGNKREGKDETQIKLFDESDENKKIGLMVKDVKINEEFFLI